MLLRNRLGNVRNDLVDILLTSGLRLIVISQVAWARSSISGHISIGRVSGVFEGGDVVLRVVNVSTMSSSNSLVAVGVNVRIIWRVVTEDNDSTFFLVWILFTSPFR